LKNTNYSQKKKRFETFEEIPIISREKHVKILKSLFCDDLTQESLINLATFYINSIHLHAKNKLTKNQARDFFVCLTFDLSDDDFWGFYVPNILVTRKISLFKFILDIKKNENFNKEKNPLISSFSDLSMENSFVFCRITHDDLSISRQYAIPTFYFERLKLAQ